MTGFNLKLYFSHNPVSVINLALECPDPIFDAPHSRFDLETRLTNEQLWLINEFRCYEAKIEESEKGRQPPGVKPRTPLA